MTLKAKLNLYLAADGCERLAKAGPDSYWHWSILPRIVATVKDGEWVEHPSSNTALPEGCKLIGVADIELPGYTEATMAAVEGLKAQLIRERAEFMKKETEVSRRINELLALPFEGGEK